MNLSAGINLKNARRLLFSGATVAVLVIAAAVLYSAWPVFKSPPYYFPVTSDAIGH